jgi:RHS repeat-associated protein
MAGVSTSFDGYLAIIDSTGQLVASNEGTQYFAELSTNLPEAGTYTVVVGTDNRSTSGTYEVSTGSGVFAPVNDSTYSGSFTSQHQYYELTVTDARNVTIEMALSGVSSSSTHGYLAIIDSAGQVVASNAGTRYFVDLSTNLPAAGTYTVVVGTDTRYTAGTYTVSTGSGTFTKKLPYQLSNIWSNSVGPIYSSIRNHRYNFELLNNELVFINTLAEGISSEIQIYILNQNNSVVFSQKGTSTKNIFEEELSAGEYTLVVTTSDVGDSGSYSISSNQAKFTQIIPVISLGSWALSGGKDHTSAGNFIKQIDLVEQSNVTVGVEADAANPYVFILNSTGGIVAQSGTSYDDKLAEVTKNLDPGTYYVVAATVDVGVTDDLTITLLGAEFTEFTPQEVIVEIPSIQIGSEEMNVSLFMPFPILGGDFINPSLAFFDGVSNEIVDLTQYACAAGTSCNINVDLSNISDNSIINWTFNADVKEDESWVTKELISKHSLVNLDLVELNDFKTETYYVPVTINIPNITQLQEYENFRLKYSYKERYNSNEFEEFIVLITVPIGQDQVVDIDLTNISKMDNEYEDSAKLFVQILADKKATENSAVEHDVVLDTSEKVYNTTPLIKIRESFSTDGIFKYSVLIPNWFARTEIYYTPDDANTVYSSFNYVPGPELVEHELFVGTVGNENFRLRGVYGGYYQHGGTVYATINDAKPPELTLGSTNNDSFVALNGTRALVRWTSDVPMTLYCPGSCAINLEYRMIEGSGTTTQWKIYPLDSRHETSENPYFGNSGQEQLWFDDIQSGTIEVKLVAEYTDSITNELQQTIIAEQSTVVEPTVTFVPPLDVSLPAAPLEWIYAINWLESTDSNYEVEMRWPIAGNDDFTLERLINDVWHPIYNGNDNGWIGSIDNVVQGEPVQLRLTSCQGATCYESFKNIEASDVFSFNSVTTESSDVFEFSWYMSGIQADFVRVFYTDDVTLFDQPINQGWQELSYGTGLLERFSNGSVSSGYGYMRHMPDMLKGAFRIFGCSNEGYCFTPLNTEIVNFPLGPPLARNFVKRPEYFMVALKPYRDGGYQYQFNIEHLGQQYNRNYSVGENTRQTVMLSDFNLTNIHDWFTIKSSAFDVGVSSSYGDKSGSPLHVIYTAGEAVGASAQITSSPGCNQDNLNCGQHLVDPFNAGTVSAVISHPNGIKNASVYIERSGGAERALISDVVKTDTEWRFTANIADTGALNTSSYYKIFIEGATNTGDSVKSNYYRIKGDESQIVGPTTIDMSGDATKIRFSWDHDAGENSKFTGYHTTESNTLTYKNNNFFDLHNPNNSGTFGVKACYYFDDITRARATECNNFIYVSYSLASGTLTCSGEHCSTNNTEPAKPAAPTLSSTSPDESGAFTLSWNAPTGVTLYNIYESMDGAEFAKIASNINYTSTDSIKNTQGIYQYYVEACNSSGCTASSTVNITISSGNGLAAKPQALSTDKNEPLNIILTGVDEEALVGNLIFTHDSPSHGTLSGTAPTLTYTPYTNYVGEDSFTFTISDGQATSTSAAVNITVNSIEEPSSLDWLAKGGGVNDAALVTPASSANTYNGAMAGSASVNGGSANYSIPIVIAPGRAGMQPNVSLNYSSRSGLGVAGVGWGLSAGGAISRCGNTEAQDGFTKGVSYDQSTDKLCLNGERLLLKSGTYGSNGATYITEIDSFAIVTQVRGDISNSDSYFEVALASGVTQVYGNTTDSKVVANGVTAPISWLINRVQDVANVNHMTYNYTDFGVGEVLLADITYTGDGSSEGTRRITFDYDAIPHYRTSYLAGGKSRQSQKLTTITVYKEGSTKVRQYNLEYLPSSATDRLLLQSVEECGNGTPCRETTSFDWLDAATTYRLEQLTTNTGIDLVDSVTIENVEYAPEIVRALPRGDIDGNGSRDWANYFTDAEGNSTGANNFEYEACKTNYITKQVSCIDADFDLDGRTDVWEIDANEFLKITYADDESTPLNATTAIDLSHSSAVSSNELVNIGDYNGDGWPDVVVSEAVQSIPTSSWSGDVYIYFHSKNKTNPYSLPKEHMLSVLPNESIQYVGDIDGDGLPDLASSKLIDPTWDSRPTMTSVHLTRIDNQRSVSFDTMPLSLPDSVDNHESFSMLIDVNGDGLSDWVGWVPGQGAYLHLRLNKGDGTFKTPQLLDFELPVQPVFLPVDGGSEITIVPKFADALKSMDIDGDGRAELIMPGNDASDMLVEACVEFSEYSQLSDSWSVIERCGSSIYSPYYIKVNNAGIRTNAPSRWDHNIYKYKALRFIENTNGTFSIEYNDTGLVAGANHSAVIDSFGKGLADLVFINGCNDALCTRRTASGEMVGKAENKVHFNRNYGATEVPAPSPEDYEPTDMLKQVTNNATGLISQWQYLPLSSTQAGAGYYYADFSDVDDAHFNFASSMYVVAKFEQSNGVGSLNAYNYEYRSAMYNSEGRGFRGFRTITEKDVRSGISTETNFLQKFPYSSLVENQSRYLSVDKAFSYTENYWKENTNYTGVGYNLYNASSTAYSCELSTNVSCDNNNYLIKSETSTLQTDVDYYGNVALQTTTITDDYGIYKTDKGAVFDESESWPHKVTSSFVTSHSVSNRNSDVTIAANTDEEKTVTTTYANYNSHRKPETVTTTGDGVSTTTATTYTSFAQLDVTIVSGLVDGQIQNRKTDIDYSTDGYFPEKVKIKASDTVTHTTSMVTDSGTGQPTSQTNAANVITTYLYDSFGRLEQVSQAGMPAQTIRYYTPDSNAGNSNAVLMMVTRQAGVPESAVYQNALGQTLRTRTKGFDGSNIYQDTIYDERGLVKKQSNLHSGIASYTNFDSYDALGRLKKKTSPQTNGNLVTEYSYNHANSLETKIDVTPSVSTSDTSITLYKTYNALKQLVSTTDANTGSTYYAYDGQGNPIVIKDAKGNQITAKYDALGRKEWVNDPNMGRTDFVYNAFGELESETDASANEITITYDVDLLGRVIERTADGNTATFRWDTLKHGLLSWHSNSNVTKTFTYDDYAKVKTTTIEVDSDSYTTTNSYDGNYGRLKSMEYPNGLTVGYKYNSNGYLSEEYNAQSNYNYRTITELNSFGDITQATLGDSAADITITNSYHDISGQMLSSSAMGNFLGAPSTIHSLHYDSYDSYGNLTTASNGAINGDNIMIANETFTYDNLHRLESAQITAGSSSAIINYGYDAAGNFTHKSDYSANNASAYEYVAGTNKLNQITLKDNSIVSFGYDAKGNQTERDGKTEVTYNSFNKPLTIIKNSTNLEFNYGADLMRYKQQRTVNGEVITTHYIDKHYEVEKNGSNTTTKAYISDVAIISDGDQTGDKSIRFTLKDRLGSTTTFADHNGNGTSYRYFDPFGKPRSGDRSLLSSLNLAPQLANNTLDIDMATRRGFTDHEHLDEVELIHMNGRVYDYNLGRFLSVDPFIQSPGDSQSVNPYSYLMNNPLAGTDPTGYCAAATGTRIKSCGDMKVEVKVDGKTVGSTVVKNVNFKNGADVSSAMSKGAGRIAGAFKAMDIKSNANIAKQSPTDSTPNGETPVSANKMFDAFKSGIKEEFDSSLEDVKKGKEGAFNDNEDLGILSRVMNSTEIVDKKGSGGPYDIVNGKMVFAEATMGCDVGCNMTVYEGFYSSKGAGNRDVYTAGLKKNSFGFSEKQIQQLRLPVSGGVVDRQILTFAHELYHGTSKNLGLQKQYKGGKEWPQRDHERHASQKALLFYRKYGDTIKRHLN